MKKWGPLLVAGLLAACAPQPAGVENPAPVTPVAEPTVAPTRAPTATPLPLGVPVQVVGGAYVNLTPAELAGLLENKDFVLINTHEPYGYEIAQTDAHIPVDEEGRWLSAYPADQSAMIVLYCRSGRWSSLAAGELVRAGYVNVWHLDGGMVAWHAHGLPLQGN